MDKQTYSLLKLFKQRDSLSLIGIGAIYNRDFTDFSSPISWMLAHNYLTIVPDIALLEGYDLTPDKPLKITQEGIIALDEEIKAQRKFKYNELRAWITVLISIIALILSIVK